ncbi:Serine/threonine-protein kinase PrkC [Planctomycetes bacterium Pan216]|uniref:Serine/threonine-protein kinase PrkC n=1 Tax=Kolteria novifilia TaxID=2527975 RepID=A0A518B911_9BACT|nr:Serine/threonine-protein kinase PrkC [Planctomycetes bacterium Pan216]
MSTLSDECKSPAKSQETPQEFARRVIRLQLLESHQVEDAFVAGVDSTPKLIQYLTNKSLLSNFQVAKLLRGDTTGFFAGRFKILYLLASGTFGHVFRGVDPQTGDAVAIKILRENLAGESEAVESFYREAKLQEKLKHPNICQVICYALDERSGQHYIALDFIEGSSLRDLLTIRKKFDHVEVARWGAQLVDGLRYAFEEQHITHRDVKPSNVLISTCGLAKWIDFGLGGTVDRDGSDLNYDVKRRTVEYAALEKATNAPKGDHCSDIYFLGMIFYEMLRGKRPVPEAKDHDPRFRFRFDDVEPLRSKTKVPRGIADIVDRMMSFDPSERYSDYSQILKDFQTYQLSIGEDPTGTQVLASREKPRLMVVHQKRRTREKLRDMLNDRGYQVAVFEDMDRAVSIFKLKPVDAMILDLDTVGRGGVSSFARLVDDAPWPACDCAGVFLATDSQKLWIKRLRSERVNTVQKPLTFGPLYIALKDLVPVG